jgi:hypothetical protein
MDIVADRIAGSESELYRYLQFDRMPAYAG